MNPYAEVNASRSGNITPFLNPTTASLLAQATTGQSQNSDLYNKGEQALRSSQSTAQPITDNSQQSGNWFTQLLPTAGGIIGGIGGGILGGIAAPFTGGLVNPFDGAIAGASLLSGGGKAVENGLEGKDLGSDVGENAVEGGVGQLIGGGTGKLLEVGARKGLDLLGNVVENRAADTLAQDTAQNAVAENQRIADTFGGVKSGQGNVGNALQHAGKFGFDQPTAQDLTSIGSAATGSNPKTGIGALNFFKQQALEKAGGTVNLDSTISDLKDTLQSPEIENNLGSIEPVSSARGQLPVTPSNTATQIIKQVRNLLPGDTLDANGQLTRQLSPQEGVDLLRQVGEKVGATANTKSALGVDIPEKVAENNVWKSLYNNVKNSVYDRPEVNSTVQGMQVGPEEEAVIDDAIRSNGITDPQQAAALKSHFIDTINNAQSAPDIMKAEAPFVNVSRVGNAATNDINSDVTSARGIRRANAGITPSSLGTNVDGSINGVESAPTAPSKGGKLLPFIDTAALAASPITGGASLLGLLPHAAQLAKNPAIQDNLYNLLTKNGVTKKVAGLIPGALNGASQFITHGNDFNGGPGATGANMVPTQTPNAQSVTNPNQQALALGLQLLHQGMGAGVDPYLAGNYASQINNGSSLISQVLPNIQANNTANAALQSTEQAYNNAGGGQGLIPGLIAKAEGAVSGNQVNAYAQQKQQLATQLQSLGIPASAIPDVTDTSPAAQSQWQELASLIASGAGAPRSASAIPVQ